MKKDFSELIEYLDDKFNEAENDRADIRNEVKDLREAVNTYAKKADTYFQEMVMLSHKVDRHEKWFRQVAEKLDIKLDY
jgi:prefoldin subunit 5